MHLFEAILDANNRAVAGDASAGLHPAEFADELPVIALTCIDPRLNLLFPNVLGIPAEQFIWLRNAGNLVTGPSAGMMRSLALACALDGGREIAIIGHTDCLTCKTTTMQLLDQLKALGVERSVLPENLNEFFGVFSGERQNVIKACDFVRNSPLIGLKIPVHGLLVNIETGKLDWVVNGYDTLSKPSPVAPVKDMPPTLTDASTEELGAGGMAGFQLGEMKFPEMKIGDAALSARPLESPSAPVIRTEPAAPPIIKPATLPPLRPGKVPLPPPIRPRITR